MMYEQDVRTIFLIVAFTVPRMMSALLISPFFGDQFIQGMARQVVIISLSLMAIPITLQSGIIVPENSYWPLFLLGVLIKEIAIGMLIGFGTGLVFWIAEGTGFFIDNQRGSSMAEMFDPMSGGSSSLFGVLFTKVLGVLFFLGGGFSAFLTIVYDSYLTWPVFSYFPQFQPTFAMASLNLLDGIMGLIVTYSAPIIIAMFIAEFGLGLMNRFSPQLNVFFLAMPVKSGIASLLIVFYLVFLLNFFKGQIMTPEKWNFFYQGFFK
ncbi:type III secretion protein T [Prosthecobacter fusiformis]|uniref:Type III secretion protein T n=1 Tax=Prosthecobacter fusiformis TaxID=48464 RepID=A0A4R7RXY7_9BACT|nr:type III secretion system export apparatus subunit SctT [Prosthecobacter fusiformis]TDU70692.1 type III secretion protein T [Prosthecobacter fusiformis]